MPQPFPVEQLPIRWNRLDETGAIPPPLREGLGVGLVGLGLNFDDLR